ncbi:ribosomal protein L4/L1 family protein [Elsinoe australis]|uniref:Large ribosomal subunit protein uL4m n=1 Tax=Elsinoe australis TaxID=40998 RepID=A0A4U7ASD7_9PEZI|nr:ribosomal protein L4/L1 family protein [Elsinoe australis]
MGTHFRTSQRPATLPMRGLSTEATTTSQRPIEASSSAPIPPELTTSAESALRPNLAPKTVLDLNPQPPNPFQTEAPITLYSFPEYKPVSTTSFPGSHLLLPLRRDILHKAVIYEGDRTRQGTANTKTRYEVHGSHRKIRPQKGTGSARLGNKQSPMLRGGGVAFGPKPRSFATDLPKKIYDLAWRTALSYRYRRGELVVLDGEAEIDRSGPGNARWVSEMLKWNGWGAGTGGSLIVTEAKRANLWSAIRENSEGWQILNKRDGTCKTIDEVDVKNLLEGGRVIVELKALQRIFERHTHDLKTRSLLASWREEHKLPARFRA